MGPRLQEPDRERRKGSGKGASQSRQGGNSRPLAGRGAQGRAVSPSTPWCGHATEQEMGETWHFSGQRKWDWMHDGERVNGWVEFGTGGALRHSFRLTGSSTWEHDRGGRGRLVLTFGRCHHICELLPGRSVPTFAVLERVMKDGSEAKSKRGQKRTLGRLASRAAGASDRDTMGPPREQQRWRSNDNRETTGPPREHQRRWNEGAEDRPREARTSEAPWTADNDPWANPGSPAAAPAAPQASASGAASPAQSNNS